MNLIIKGDVDGSIEALSDSLQKLSTEKVQVNIIHKAVGQISDSDVLLASASNAIIIGFQVRPSASARKLAEQEEIQINLYSIIYKAIEEMRDAMEGLLSAKIEENIVGSAEIRETFKISKVGTIAGCFVTEGKILRSSKVRVIREGVVVYTGALGSLKRFKDDAKEVAKGLRMWLEHRAIQRHQSRRRRRGLRRSGSEANAGRLILESAVNEKGHPPRMPFFVPRRLEV